MVDAPLAEAPPSGVAASRASHWGALQLEPAVEEREKFA